MSDTPADFFRSCGLLVDQPINDGRWHRVPTADHPRKRNGSYRLDGTFAACQNWATMPQAAVWTGEAPAATMSDADRAAAARRRAAAQATQHQGWARAAAQAQAAIAGAKTSHHGYLMRKGFGEAPGLVAPDGALLVPMRDVMTNELRGLQAIRWNTEAREWEKKFTPGMRAGGAVLRLGGARPEAVLCEGLATGMSIELAARERKLAMAVVVCFSAGNIITVAKALEDAPGKRYVFADNDAAGAGQRAAEATGLPWAMAPTPGDDANDLHVKDGLLALGVRIMAMRRGGIG